MTSCGTREVVLASRTMTWTRGWAACTADSSCGTSQRAVVPMTPRRVSPVTSWPMEVASAERASSSRWIRRARATTTTPSGVSRPLARSTRVTPSSRSRCAMWAEMLDWTV